MFEPSSETKSAPSFATETPTGRPHTSPSGVTKPVRKSTYSPVGDAFAALHGSWNRAKRTGYKVIRVPQRRGVPTGEYVDFLTGFVTPEGDVWGRPVGVSVAKDGALFVSDDGSNAVWRVSYAGR